MAGGDVFAPVRWKNLDLRDPKIALTTDRRATARLVARALRRGGRPLRHASRPTAPAASRPTPSPSSPAIDAEIRFTPPTATPPASPSPSATSIPAYA